MASTAAASSAAPFTFPREYHFPPFFTRQTNLTTRHAQLTKWSALVQAYCRHHRIFKLSLGGDDDGGGGGSGGSGGGGGGGGSSSELFHNRALGRRLSAADVREVVDFMRAQGRAESASSPDVVWVYWRTPDEWAQLVEAWVDDTAQRGSVLTLYELAEGDAALGSELHGLDRDLLLRALQVLAKRGRAQVFGNGDELGVKFF